MNLGLRPMIALAGLTGCANLQRPATSADAAKPTQVEIITEGKVIKDGKEQEVKLKTTLQASPSLESQTKNVELQGSVEYHDATGKKHTMPVTLKGNLVATQDESARPFSFVDVQAGLVLPATKSDIRDYGTLPLALKLSAGIIPSNELIRYGVALSVMRAGFDNESKCVFRTDLNADSGAT